MFTCVALGYLGAKPAEGAYVLWAPHLHGLLLRPLPDRDADRRPHRDAQKLPRSIAEAVLGKGGGGSRCGGAPAAPEKR